MEENVARVKLNLIAFQLGCCSLITPDLHNSLNNCLSKRKYQPCIPGGTVRITAKAPTNIHRAPMATAKKGIRSKNPAGWKTRVGAYLSRANEFSPRCALLTSSVKQSNRERSRNPGQEEIRSGESGRAGCESDSRVLRCAVLRSVPECGAVPKPGEESTTSSLRSLVAVGQAKNSGRKQITGGVTCPLSRAADAPAAGTLPGAETPDGSLPVGTFCAPRLSTHFFAARRS